MPGPTCSLSSTSPLKSAFAERNLRNFLRSAFCTDSFCVATKLSSMMLRGRGKGGWVGGRAGTV